MGGELLVALNLLGWATRQAPRRAGGGGAPRRPGRGPRGALSRGGGHSIDDPEPKYGMAVTGTADLARLLLIDGGRPGLPLSVTKPTRHRGAQCLAQGNGPGQRGSDRRDDDSSRRRQLAGACRRDQVRDRHDRIGPAQPPVQAGQGQRGLRRRRPRGGCRSSGAPGRRCGPGICLAGAGGTWNGCSRTPTRTRWVRKTCCCSPGAQTSGGLLGAGELPGATVIGELVPRRDSVLIIW
jgi:selenide,water dikinase